MCMSAWVSSMAVCISVNESVGPDADYNLYSVNVNAHYSVTADHWFQSLVSLMCLEILMDIYGGQFG
jgi:hypothetical protein